MIIILYNNNDDNNDDNKNNLFGSFTLGGENTHQTEILLSHNKSAPARLRLPVPHVSTKPLKSSLSLHTKILFLHMKPAN